MGGLLMMLAWIVLGLVVFVIPAWLDDRRDERAYQIERQARFEKKEALL